MKREGLTPTQQYRGTATSHSINEQIIQTRNSAKKHWELNHAICQKYLTAYRTFHPTDAEFIFFKINHKIKMNHKTNLNNKYRGKLNVSCFVLCSLLFMYDTVFVYCFPILCYYFVSFLFSILYLFIFCSFDSLAEHYTNLFSYFHDF